MTDKEFDQALRNIATAVADNPHADRINLPSGLRWEAIKSEGKHVYWRYGDGNRNVGYVSRDLDWIIAGVYPQTYRFGQRIGGGFRTIASAKRHVELYVQGPGRHLLDADGSLDVSDG